MSDPNTDAAYVADLENAIEKIWDIARRMGLDPYPVNFELVPATIMYEFGSYGLPGRFSHWSRGKAYYRMKTEYDYGLSKIYELVVNTNPSYAFLMEQNDILQNKVVVAHVLGHTDMFKNNVYFKHTPPNMIDKVSVNADRIRKYEYEHGTARSSASWTRCWRSTSISIRTSAQARAGRRARKAASKEKAERLDGVTRPIPSRICWGRMGAPSNAPRRSAPPSATSSRRSRRKTCCSSSPSMRRPGGLAARHPADRARGDAVFRPADADEGNKRRMGLSLTHARIMREMDLTDADYAAFAQMHSGVLAASRMHINPYLLGYHILEDIERRWDNPTEEERVKLGRVPGQGRAKLFEVRETESDVSLLRNYLTKDLIEDLDLYLYAKEDDEWVIVEKNWEKVRDGIVASMTNFGYPYITIEDADFNRNSELLLKHHFERYELDVKYAQKTLEYVYAIWSRPVHLDTVFEERPVRMSYDGEDHDSNFVESTPGEIPF